MNTYKNQEDFDDPIEFLRDKRCKNQNSGFLHTMEQLEQSEQSVCDLIAQLETIPKADDDIENENDILAVNEVLNHCADMPEKQTAFTEFENTLWVTQEILESQKNPLSLDEIKSMMDETCIAESISDSVSKGVLNFESANACFGLLKTKHGGRDSTDSRAKEKVSRYGYACHIYEEHEIRCLDEPGTDVSIHRFDGRVWIPIDSLWVKQQVYEAMGEEERHGARSLDSICRDVFEYLKIISYSAYLNGQCFSAEDFRKVENRIVFSNCVYDAQLGVTLPFDYTLPYERGVNVEYVEEDQCGPTPYYNKLRSDATGNDYDSMRMFDHMLGYLLIPSQRGKAFFYLSEAKDAGKSVLIECIQGCFDSNRCFPLELDQLDNRFGLGDAGMAHLYVCAEKANGPISQKARATIKTSCGDGLLRSEKKYQNAKSVKARGKIIIAGNDALKHEGEPDAAFYRRAILIPFLYSTPKEELIGDLKERLAKELDYIMSNAARSLKEIIDDNGGIVIPESQLSVRQKASCFIKEKDEVERFLDETVMEEEGNRISSETLYDLYCDYQAPNKRPAKKLGKRKFKCRVLDRFENCYTNKVRMGGPNPISVFENLKFLPKALND